jgi:hypothetical protein
LISERGLADRLCSSDRGALCGRGSASDRHLFDGRIHRPAPEVAIVFPLQALKTSRLAVGGTECFLAPQEAIIDLLDRLMGRRMGRIQMLDEGALVPRQIAFRLASGATVVAEEGKGCLEAGLQLEGQPRVGRHEVDGVIPKRLPSVEPLAATVKLGSLLALGVAASPAIGTGLAGDTAVLLLYALVAVGLSAPCGSLFRRQIPASLSSAGTDRQALRPALGNP